MKTTMKLAATTAILAWAVGCGGDDAKQAKTPVGPDGRPAVSTAARK